MNFSLCVSISPSHSLLRNWEGGELTGISLPVILGVVGMVSVLCLEEVVVLWVDLFYSFIQDDF